MNNDWNPNNYEVRVPNNRDPVSLNKIRSRTVYFSIPTRTNQARVSLSRKTLTNLLRSGHPTHQGQQIIQIPAGHIVTPWELINLRQMLRNHNLLHVPLFKNPVTRNNVTINQIKPHTAP